MSKKFNKPATVNVGNEKIENDLATLKTYNRQDVAAIILNCIIKNANNGIEPKMDFATILKVVDVSNGEEFETQQQDLEDITYDGEPNLDWNERITYDGEPFLG